MKNLENKVAVVTGASSGIGRALALRLAEKGCHLSICSYSRQEALMDTAREIERRGRRVFQSRINTGNRQGVEDFCQKTIAIFGQADILVNNAGVGLVAPIEEMDYDDFNWVMQTNFWGMVYGTKAFLPHLRTRPEAAVANISSVWGFWASPLQGAYTSSKFAIRGFTEALGQELAGSRVFVSLVMPGAIRTDIAKNARIKADLGPVKGREGILRFFDVISLTSPEEAARVIVRAIQKKRRRVLVGPDAYVLDAVSRLLPSLHQRIIPMLL